MSNPEDWLVGSSPAFPNRRNFISKITKEYSNYYNFENTFVGESEYYAKQLHHSDDDLDLLIIKVGQTKTLLIGLFLLIVSYPIFLLFQNSHTMIFRWFVLVLFSLHFIFGSGLLILFGFSYVNIKNGVYAVINTVYVISSELDSSELQSLKFQIRKDEEIVDYQIKNDKIENFNRFNCRIISLENNIRFSGSNKVFFEFLKKKIELKSRQTENRIYNLEMGNTLVLFIK